MILAPASARAVLVLQMSKLLALDQSSYTSGYTILNDGEIVEVSHFECTGDLSDRLVQIRNIISKLIKDNNINEVVFEDIQLQDVNGNRETGIKTFKILAEVYGVVDELLTELNIQHSAVLPIKWKAHFKIAGKGRSQEKKMAQAYVKNKCGLTCTEDEADSLCIALYHYNESNQFDWS